MNTEVKERPILMCTPMVLATLAGIKTQTRRVVTPKPDNGPDDWDNATTLECGFYFPTIYDKNGTEQPADEQVFGAYNCEGEAWKCPFGKVGDRLWCKETHYRFGKWAKNGFTKTGKQAWTFDAVGKEVKYLDKPPVVDLRKRGERDLGWYKRPSIFMPRWASRITLEITGIRVERVQDISEADAQAEGVSGIATHTPYPRQFRDSFEALWDSINAKRGYPWSSNPWVWVIEFKRLTL